VTELCPPPSSTVPSTADGRPTPGGPTGPHGVVEPVGNDLSALLRRAVLDHARAERRRVFPPVLHVGVPGLVTARLELSDAAAGERLDHALRSDAVAAMLRRVRRPGPPPLVWLTRRGPLEVQDRDLAWRSSALAAAGEQRVRTVFVVVDKHGWRDPGTGVGRTWVRAR